MRILADCHLHTDHSGDSTAKMEEQILAGLERGLEYMCFTDHYDPGFPYDALPDMEAGTFDLDHASYRKEYLEMKERYSGRLNSSTPARQRESTQSRNQSSPGSLP